MDTMKIIWKNVDSNGEKCFGRNTKMERKKERKNERKKEAREKHTKREKIAREIRKQRPSVNLVLCLSTMAI